VLKLGTVRRLVRRNAIKREESVQSQFQLSRLRFAAFPNLGRILVWEASTERDVRLCLSHVPVRSKGNEIYNGKLQIGQLVHRIPARREGGHLLIIVINSFSVQRDSPSSKSENFARLKNTEVR